MCKCVIRLDWKVHALNDKVSISCCFVIAVFFGELILMWLWSPPWPQEGNHGLSLCDQFSGICRDVYMKLTKPLSEWPDAAVSDWGRWNCCKVKPPNTAYYSNVPLGEFDRYFLSLKPLLLAVWGSCNSYWMDCFPFKTHDIYVDVKKVFTSEVCIHVCS